MLGHGITWVGINGVPTSNSSFLTVSGITTETGAIEFVQHGSVYGVDPG